MLLRPVAAVDVSVEPVGHRSHLSSRRDRYPKPVGRRSKTSVALYDSRCSLSDQGQARGDGRLSAFPIPPGLTQSLSARRSSTIFGLLALPYILSSILIGLLNHAAISATGVGNRRLRRAAFLRWDPTSNYGMMLSMRWKWHKLFSYGEVICFVTAWAVGLLLARDQGRFVDRHENVRSIATTTNLPGVQAALRP